jgi:hypothetical protein
VDGPPGEWEGSLPVAERFGGYGSGVAEDVLAVNAIRKFHVRRLPMLSTLMRKQR